MPIGQRAKIFLPFAGVRGLDEALERKRLERLIEERIVLTEESEGEINEVLSKIESGDRIKVSYYDGMRYTTDEGRLIRKNKNEGCLLMENSLVIFFSDIHSIEKLKEN